MYSKSLEMFRLSIIIFMLYQGNGFSLRHNVYNMVAHHHSPLSSVDIDNTTEDLLKSWNSTCNNPSGGTVTVPPGTFQLDTVQFTGPCKGPITFDVSGTLQAPSDPSKGEDYWISFINVDGLTISGTGTFDGQGQTTWSKCKKASCNKRAASLKFLSVRNAQIQGINSINSKYFHFHIYKCENFYVNGVSITAPEDSPNTDGIHISNSNNVQVSQVSIATGDDCISIGPGNTQINISNVDCGPGHGISIGSLGKTSGERPVTGVTVSDCTLTGTTNGLRIKTFAPSPKGSVSDITFQNINIKDVNNPIIIDQSYCESGSCGPSKDDSQVQISDVKFINVKGTSASEVSVTLDCSRSVPCQGILLQGLNLSYKNPNVPSKATCSNCNGTFDGSEVPGACMTN